jgi:site-specific DNA-cytosine methylase
MTPRDLPAARPAPRRCEPEACAPATAAWTWLSRQCCALAWCAETDRHAAAVLAACFPGVPNLGDLTGAHWAAVPPVDLVTAGFPRQDISTAGRGAGLEKGSRSGLSTHIAEAVGQLPPGYVLCTKTFQV